MGYAGYFLVGATASGKSALAHYLARKMGTFVVSADSMNLYRGMDIGTAKPSRQEQEEVRYEGIDLVSPTEKFSVAKYLDAVRPAFRSRIIPIVAGGTGLYVKCLTEGFCTVPSENVTLRSELELYGLVELQKRLRALLPEEYEKLSVDDQQNPRRLIRMIEKAKGGADFLKQRTWNQKSKSVLVGLYVERSELHQRIARRVEEMYEGGLLEEARILLKMSLSKTALQAIGYAEAFGVLNNELTLDEAKKRTIIRTRQLAKRQMTWLRNQLEVEWIDTADFSTQEELADAVLQIWEKRGAASIVFSAEKSIDVDEV